MATCEIKIRLISFILVNIHIPKCHMSANLVAQLYITLA